MSNRARFYLVIALLSVSVFMQSSTSQDHAQDPAMATEAQSQKHGKSVVYVCACLKNKSCSCMSEAKMQGPCACGTQGGPPMKQVPSDSDWAKENRNALAQTSK